MSFLLSALEFERLSDRERSHYERHSCL